MQSHVTNFNQSECIILELFFSEIFKPMILGSGDKVNMVETKCDFYMLGEKIYHLLWHKNSIRYMILGFETQDLHNMSLLP